MTSTDYFHTVNRQRRAGVLLHPTSLPGPLANGDIGHEAYRFIEFLSACGFKVWQMLPLGPTHEDKSPYQCLSSHAGSPMLISLNWLEDKKWLDRDTITVPINDDNYRLACLKQAGDNFYRTNNDDWRVNKQEFEKINAYWLNDYCLFMALKIKYQNKPWYEWPDAIRQRNTLAMTEAGKELKTAVDQYIFEQFVFFIQWHEIRDYAKQHDVELFGDMPIFVARDSADVWSQKKNFLMDDDGDMPFVAGVPPDAFSNTGQRWGNPLYDWDYMQSNGFSWWKDRFTTQLKLFDMVRIDHFRGLQACWQIPADEETAMNGQWVEVPGKEMLQTLFETFDDLPLVAEDLGVITDQVIELKNYFNLSGMKVLQFAFDGNNNNPHLPHRHEHMDLAYTGTHDNDTTLGWVSEQTNYNKEYFEEYIGLSDESNEQRVWAMTRLAMSSVSFLSVLPMQDILMLDSSARMNIPGTVNNNWLWRYNWSQVNSEMIANLSHLMMLYQR